MRVLDGPDFDLIKYRGYPVWLNIFATWCEPCTREMPTIVQTANEYFDRGLRVIGINFRESDNTVRAYRKRFSIPYPIAMDGEGGFVSALERGMRDGTLEFPVSLFITPDGYLYCYHVGSMSDSEMSYRVSAFLKDAPPSAAAPATQPHT
jgi:thiol-disulfide isomerase/thioredoxin